MAKLPIYNAQGNITNETSGVVKPVQQDSTMADALINTGKALGELAEQWQNSKDQVETLDAKNKLFEQSSNVLQQAEQFTGYTDQKQIDEARVQFQQQLSQVTPSLLQGFSSQRAAKNFQLTSQMANRENQIKLDAIMRNKTIDLGTSNLLKSADLNMKAFTKSGNVAYKNNYFADIDGAFKAGIIDAEKVTALKQSTDDWNYNFVYSQLLTNPYYKASKEIMDGIDPVKQRTLQNFARTEQKRIHAEAVQNAVNDYYLNPTKANYNRMVALNPKLKGNKRLASAMGGGSGSGGSGGISSKAKSFNIMDASDVTNRISQMSRIDTSTPQGQREYLNASLELGYKIMASGLDQKTKDKQMQLVYKNMSNVEFRQKLNKLPNLERLQTSEYVNQYGKLYENYLNNRGTKNEKAAYNKWKSYVAEHDRLNANRNRIAPHGVLWDMNNLQRKVATDVMNAYCSGNIKAANQIYAQGIKDMIHLKYWYVPELQNPNLKAGDKFNVNGKIYTFQGYTSNDIIVEVNK